jgi:hypothetical protein
MPTNDELRLDYWVKYGLPEPLASACRLDGALDWYRDPGARPADPKAFVEEFGTDATREVIGLHGGLLPRPWR